MLSSGDAPICQNLVYLCERAKTSCQSQIQGEDIIFILRSEVKVIQSLWMYTTHRTMVIQSRPKQSMTMSKDKKAEALNTKPCHKPYQFGLEVKGQCRTRIMDVLDTFSHGDRPMCQIWYANVTAHRSYRSDMKTWQKPINLTLRSKVSTESGKWMYSHIFSWW